MKNKIIYLVFLIINIIFIVISPVKDISGATLEGGEATEGDTSSVISGAESFIEQGKGSNIITIEQGKLKDASDTIYNILLYAGIAIALIISMILGIQFMVGSVEEKSEVMKSLVPFVIGCVVVFGAFGIWKIAVIIGNNL